MVFNGTISMFIYYSFYIIVLRVFDEVKRPCAMPTFSVVLATLSFPTDQTCDSGSKLSVEGVETLLVAGRNRIDIGYN